MKKTVKKKSLLQKAKAILTKKKDKSGELADSQFMNADSDPAHMPGHRKMKLKDKFAKHTGSKNHAQDESSLNNMTRSAQIKRTSGTNRRIITGAAVGKTGQVVIK